jgi:hypothetical protein
MNLPGYAEYCQRTRYRLIPLDWQGWNAFSSQRLEARRAARNFQPATFSRAEAI